MRTIFFRFLLRDDTGAVAMDWVVLTAVVTTLGAGTVFIVLGSDASLGSLAARAITQSAVE